MKLSEWARLVDTKTLADIALQSSDPELLDFAEKALRKQLGKLQELKVWLAKQAQNG